MRRLMLLLVVIAVGAPLGAQDLRLPNREGTIKFAVLGDTGTGDSKQMAIAEQLAAFHERFPFEFALMLGDNLYGDEDPSDYVDKFERPYKPLLDAGVKFYAALGNHDEPTQRLYEPFNMNGQRYYTFKPALLGGVRFFAVDSNYVDPAQIQWLDKELAGSGSDWKIAFMHHSPYSSGDRHGSNLTLRNQLEPIFVKHRVNVVFTGHDHFYERLKPQKGIAYFVSGASAKLRRGRNTSELSAKVYDDGYTFILAEIDGNDLHFQAINERGESVDQGIIRKNAATDRVIGTTGTAAGQEGGSR